MLFFKTYEKLITFTQKTQRFLKIKKGAKAFVIDTNTKYEYINNEWVEIKEEPKKNIFVNK